jgi:hypothetical protein
MKMMKIVAALLLVGCNVTLLVAGPEPIVETTKPVAPTSLYRDSEFNVSLFGVGSWTKSASTSDRYFGVDHAFGGALSGKYFFAKYFGIGIDLAGYDVKNVSTPARVATSSDARRFVGDSLVSATFRYPIGTSAFAPYVRLGAGSIFNGGNRQLTEPSGTIGKKLRFELAEHDAKMIGEGAVGLEYRLNQTFGIITEGAFDKVDRPHSNFGTLKAGVNVAF